MNGYLIALPLDLLRVFGFNRTVQRIQVWRFNRAMRRVTSSMSRFGASVARLAESTQRFADALRSAQLPVSQIATAVAAREKK